MKTVIFLAEGFEEIEALTVVDVLRRGGAEIETVSVSGGPSVTGAHNIRVMADREFDMAKERAADMIVLPGGGTGTQNLKEHSGVNELCAEFMAKDKYVAAICAAPTVLGVKGLLKGKRAVCYPGCEGQLEGALIGDKIVEMDGRLITSKGPGTAAQFAFALLKIIKGGEAADKVRKGMLL